MRNKKNTDMRDALLEEAVVELARKLGIDITVWRSMDRVFLSTIRRDFEQLHLCQSCAVRADLTAVMDYLDIKIVTEPKRLVAKNRKEKDE